MLYTIQKVRTAALTLLRHLTGLGRYRACPLACPACSGCAVLVYFWFIYLHLANPPKFPSY